MNKALSLLVLLSLPCYANKCPKECPKSIELEIQKEKDLQEYRMQQLVVVSTLSLALIGAAIKVYLAKNQ